MTLYYQDRRFTLHCGDCRVVLAEMEKQSVDSVVCDPPYELGFMGKRWDRSGIAYDVSVWSECLRVLRPGGHLLAFGGSRTYHRLACAIEDAGFEIRDDIDFWYDANPIFAAFYDSLTDEQKVLLHQSAGASHLSWLYGSGFPKSLDVSKAIDGHFSVEQTVVGERPAVPGVAFEQSTPYATGRDVIPVTTATTWAAKQWNGWGTALKPAHEPVVLARKPLIGTVAENVLQHGTGGLNIDGCRIGSDVVGWQGNPSRGFSGGLDSWEPEGRPVSGRWPANVITDNSDEVLARFPDTEASKASDRGLQHTGFHGGLAGSTGNLNPGTNSIRGYSDNGGSAARFFYCSKASPADRNEGLEDLPMRSAGAVTDRKDGSAGLNSPRAGAGRKNGSRNPHPTVKPTNLIRYLCRLVTPPGGVVLDPFCGSGSTGKAAMLEEFRFIGVELNAEYCELAQRRIQAATQGQASLFSALPEPKPARVEVDTEPAIEQTTLFSGVGVG